VCAIVFTLQEEQEEIMKARASSQKRLSIKEIKKMVYLSQVIILGDNLSLTHFIYNIHHIINDNILVFFFLPHRLLMKH
jgi:phosphoribosyl-ATP pyrophosphohydrolase